MNSCIEKRLRGAATYMHALEMYGLKCGKVSIAICIVHRTLDRAVQLNTNVENKKSAHNFHFWKVTKKRNGQAIECELKYYSWSTWIGLVVIVSKYVGL